MSIRYLLKLYGPFEFGLLGGAPLALGAKQQALIAMLALSPQGSRTRGFLQDTLWGNVQSAQAKGSLRNALSQVRKMLGDRADDLLTATRDRVTLNLSMVDLAGDPADGDFLEGMELRSEQAFVTWLQERRDEMRAGRIPDRLEAERLAAAGTQAAARAPAPAGPAPFAAARGLMSAAAAAAAAPFAVSPDLELRPAIAVLPFRDFGDDAGGGLGDALAEDVSRALSRSRGFNVISHLSSRHFAARRATLPQVTAELNPRFLVTGEIRASGERFRLNVDLHDAQSMRLLESREHFGDVPTFLRGELDVARTVVVDASRAAAQLAAEAVRARPLPSLAVHELLMAAIGLMHGADRTQFFLAKEMLDAAVARVPGRAELHAWLGKWHVLRVMKGFGGERDGARAEAIAAAKAETARALDIDPVHPTALTIDGFVHSHLAGEMDVAETRYRQAIEVDENDAFAWLLFGTLHAFRDQAADAVRFTERARRLSPLDPQRYYYDSLGATAYLADRRYAEALDLANRSLCGNRRHPSTLRVRTIALQRLGLTEEARRAAQELMRLEPGLSVSTYLGSHPAGRFETGREWAEALREAGVPL
ncbi:hypothetical protein ACQ5SO_08995 [Rhodovulum sp. DZ06]|uniref:hypothetical protein n=1 Tax=Rhodovulum sp. DZ06 TaxID=3425126 RepID=UPI003D346AD8